VRAALLPAGPDPYLLAYWLRHYRAWAPEVDELHVAVCGQDDPAIRAYLASLAGPNVTMTFGPPTDHGTTIAQLLRGVDGLVLLCEDDAFVRDPVRVRESFERIERGETDVVGSPRSTGTPDILEHANARFGQLIATTGEAGPILWPCFLFARSADLARTDGNYSVWGCPPGTTVLGRTFEREQVMDTFGWASLQLRENGARVHVEPNHRANLATMAEWTDAPWFHVGGLSTGFGMYILGPKAHDLTGLRGTDLTDWTKRAAFWSILADSGDGPDWLRDDYRASIATLVERMGMSPDEIGRWRASFDPLINW
jgi:hypothetical protein